MSKQKNEDFLRLARERFEQSAKAESAIRAGMVEALRFRVPDNQWPDKFKRQRDSEGRPCLAIDRLGNFVHQVVNDIRQNRPSAKVRPVDDNGDVKTAEVFQGILRQIERASGADKVRGWAAEYAVSIGRGWTRVITEYADEESLDQDIFLKRIKNPFTVYPDPMAEEPDYSDMRWAFVRERMPKEEYRSRFPKSELASDITNWGSTGDHDANWVEESAIYVAEYFHIEHTDKVIEVEGRSRKVRKPVVKWCLINGHEVLEEREWPGRYIPLIPYLGEELDIEGEADLRGMIQRGMDAQRQYNYMRSAQVEAVALAPKAPWVAAEGQVEDFMGEWKNSNTQSIPVLRYNPVSVQGTVIGAPQRQTFEPAIQAITQALMQATEDMKSTFGIYDASLGSRSNEQSGRAILARQKEGDTANFHYIDNVNTGISHETRIMLDLIPKVYDRPGRIVRMLGETGDESAAMLGPLEGQTAIPQGIQGIYDLSAGRYDVAVTIGPSYATKRQEAAEALTQLAGMAPQIMERAPDIVMKALDTPYSQELADRLTPPDIAQQKQSGMDPQVQAMLQKQQEQIEAMQGFAQQLFEEKQKLEARADIEREKIALEYEKLAVSTRLKEMELGDKAAQFELQQRMAAIERQINAAHAEAGLDMQERDSERNASLAERQQQQAEAESQQQAAMAERQQGHSEMMADRQQSLAETQAEQQAKAAKAAKAGE